MIVAMAMVHMKTGRLRVLYLFAGERSLLERKWREGLMPDSQLIGFNHLKEFGIDASYIENPFLNFVRKKNFNLTNLFLLLAIRRYDVVFSGASLLLPFIAKVLLRFRKPKFVWYNTFFTNALKRNVGNQLRLWAFKKTIASLDAVVCPSTAQRDFLISQGFDSKKIFYVSNGVDADFVKSRALTEKVEDVGIPFILSVGKDMGRDYKTLSKAVEGLPIKVKVAALPRNFIDVKEVPINLEIMGFVPFDRLVELYKKALFVVIPTKSENHLDASDCSGQYVLLDAMSFGRAIIVSKRATLDDYLEEGKEGLIVPSENPGSLRSAIVKLLSDPALAKDMGDRSREKVNNIFNTRRLACELANIFKSITSR